MTSIAGLFESAVPDAAGVSPQPWIWSPHQDASACWRQWASGLEARLRTQGFDARDAMVILPVGAVLAQARQAWAEAIGGWLPRIDTIASVAEGLAWRWQAPERVAGALPPLTLDAVVDRLQAARTLGGEEWARQWAQRDRRGFEFALDQIVDAAQTWVRRLQSMPPQQRGRYIEQAREQVAGTGGLGTGPGGRERLLMAWSFEWAVSTAEAGLPTDLLYDMKPSAFVVVTAGEAVSPGTEGQLALAVRAHLHEQGVPTAWIAARPAEPDARSASRPRPPIRVACRDAEDEAQQTAAQVIALVNEMRDAQADVPPPVALIALDRSLVRRVRAVLEGAGVQIADETGWRLSTTRAAAVFSRTLQASHPKATTDDLLDWLKSSWADWHIASDDAVDAEPKTAAPRRVSLADAAGLLEAWCRRHGFAGAWSLPVVDEVALQSARATSDDGGAIHRDLVSGDAAAVWFWARRVLSPLQRLWSVRRSTLSDWLLALREALTATGSFHALQADAAGLLALQSLRIAAGGGADELDRSWQGLATQTRLDGMAFMRWVGGVMEGTTFRPAPPGGAAEVVITPMARAVLRPFHAIVLPGADERQLGALGSQSGWIGVGMRQAMDLATPHTLRAAQWDAFTLLMNRPGVICLHRQAQGSEPLEASPWLERWADQEGVTIVQGADARADVAVEPLPVPPPTPSLAQAAWALPDRITATSYEALRQCPYRFFSTSVLNLREPEELEEGVDRSDFGIWLHEVLRRFHVRRQAQLAFSTEQEDVQDWLAVAKEVVHEMGLDKESERPYFMPFEADLDRLASAYIGWLRGHEDEGWSVQQTEAAAERMLPGDDGVPVKLYGQLDRIDSRYREGQREQFVIDYKTGNADRLKAKVAEPHEDTQLAFYAALSDPASPVRAAYLHLDPKGVTAIEHADVQDSAEALLRGVAHDVARLRAGHALPALGEGAACMYCKARGLCRKDHWRLSDEDASSTRLEESEARSEEQGDVPEDSAP